MVNHYDDSALLLPVLRELFYKKQVTTRIYRAFHHADDRGYDRPRTVGELRAALREPGTRHLLKIPNLGSRCIMRLQTVFLPDNEEQER